MKKINTIKIDNFKSINHLKFENCNEINLILGPPNSGKSNILEALSLFSLPYFDFIFDNDLDLSKIIRYTNFSDLFYNQQNKTKKSIISCGKERTLELNLENKKEQEFLNIIRNENNELLYEINYKNKLIKKADYFSYYAYIEQYCDQIEYPILKYVFKEIKNTQFFNRRLIPLHGENIGMIISQNNDIQKFIKKELDKIGLELVINKSNGNVSVQKRINENYISSMEFYMLADTFQRILFYKTAILSNENSVLLFEEPEAYCYEPYILELTKDIIQNYNNNQYFIVTHSDLIVNEFINDHEIKDKINIYLINFSKEKGTEIKLLENKKEEVFNFGMSVFTNFEQLWENN